MNQSALTNGSKAISSQAARFESVLLQIRQRYRLTRRETEVLQLLATGLSNKEMASSMGISSNTVKGLLRVIMLKMGATSRAGIMATIMWMVLSQ